MATESKKRRDAFVGKVVADPKNPPNTLMLSGYLGDSSEADHTRLYFDPQLRAYIDIPDAAILHAEEMKGDLGGHHIWVDQEAEYVYGRTTAERPRAKFFEGQIMQTYGAAQQQAAAAGAAAGGVGAAQPFIPASYHYYCPPQSHLIACASNNILCRSRLILCQSQQVICASFGGWLCPSENIICESQLSCPSFAGVCPSWVDGCGSALGCTIFDPGTVVDPGRRFAQQQMAGAGMAQQAQWGAQAAQPPQQALLPPSVYQPWCPPSRFFPCQSCQPWPTAVGHVCPTQPYLCPY